jgi:hypothetical protein
MEKKVKLPNRTQRASAIVDLVLCFILLVPLALMAVNIGFMAVGTFINDSACREAARVASMQSSITNAYAAASTAVKTFSGSGPIGNPRVTSLSFNYNIDDLKKLPIDITSLSATNIDKAPYVKVSTSLTATTPAPFLLNGNSLATQIKLKSTYTFPILYAIDPDPNNQSSDSGSDNGVTPITETIVTPPDGAAP